MSDNIHHRCRCLDRNFTFEEWVAYLRETENKNDVVFTAGGFRFNINDVCCNPNIPVRFERGRCYHVTIETVQSPNGRWSCGYHIVINHAGSSRAARFLDDLEDGFPTEKEAIYDALQYARQLTEREIQIQIMERRGGDWDDDDDFEPGRKPAAKATPTMTKLRLFLAEIEKHISIYDPRQLTLF